MININKLYGVLLGSEAIPQAYQWYAKKFTPIATNAKINGILTVLLAFVPEGRRALFACLICNAILHTVFGKEITELDPVNTYMPVERPQDSANDDQSFCLFQMAGPASSYKALLQYLDKDITDRLTSAMWIDYVAAGCLQILRELNK